MKDTGFVKIYGWILNRGLKPTETIVLAYVVSNCEWHGGVCERSVAQMSEDLHLSRPTIITALNSLISGKYISKESGNNRGRGNVTRYLVNDEKGKEILPFNEEEKGKDFLPFISGKGKERKNKRSKVFTFSPNIIESNLNRNLNKEREMGARARKELEKVISDYERRALDPNGMSEQPTEEETALYEDAKARLKELDKARLADEWAAVLDEYPSLKDWHDRGDGTHFAKIVDTYGREAVMEAVAYTANRLDLKYSFSNPLGYIEGNLKRRKNNGR